MTASKPRAAQTLAAWAWAAVGLTPVGWFYGVMAIAYSHLGDVTDRNMMFGGVVLFAVAPTIAFILAVYAARAGHRRPGRSVLNQAPSSSICKLVSSTQMVTFRSASCWPGQNCCPPSCTLPDGGTTRSASTPTSRVAVPRG